MMSNQKLDAVLDVEKESANYDHEMFYRYRVGDFKLWFSQDQENGNIYSVGFVEDGDRLKDFELRISANEYGRDGYYPNKFEIRPRSYGMATGDAREFMAKMEQACRVLDAVEAFFKNSKHYALYAEKHGIEVPKGQELARVNGDFPTLEEIRRDYRELMGIIGDVKTIAQAREVAEKYGIQVEINACQIDNFEQYSFDSDIEFISYSAYGCLRDIYDYLYVDRVIKFDVQNNVLGYHFPFEITEDDLTEENYRAWVDSARKQAGLGVEEKRAEIPDEVISRKGLLAEIQAHFGCDSQGLDEDCRSVWSVIENYDLQSGDLISRNDLLNAVQDVVGCDLAYYGRDLQFFQDAIVGVPAASKGNLDALISDAEQKYSGMNKDDSKRDFAEYER